MYNQAYLLQAQRNLTTLFSNKQYKEAYSLCQELIRKFPDEPKLFKIKDQIENEVTKENFKLIDRKIAEAKPAMKSKDYGKALQILSPMIKIMPEHRKLKRLLYKAQTKYRKVLEEKSKKYNEALSKKLTELLNQNPQQLELELKLLQENNTLNKNIKKIARVFADKLIAKKIKEKESLLYSNKFNLIEEFIKKLKDIDSMNERVVRLDKIMKSKKYSTQTEQRSEFVYKGKTHLQNLIKLKKYEEAVKVASEILSLQKRNEEVSKLKKEAKDKLFKQTRKETAEHIKKDLKSLEKQFKKNQSSFIKI